MSSSTTSPSTTTEPSHFGRWMALLAALLGWLFDGAEMGIFSMVGRNALKDLLKSSNPTEADIGLYFGVIIAVFLVGAATGGVVFGWLGDRIGRVRAMSLSVLTYAVFTGLCGFAQTPLQLGFLRFIAALGMGGEWSLGVALVMEVWPNRSRALMAGLIGAAANAGYLLVGVIGIGLNSIIASLQQGLSTAGLPESTVTMLTAYGGWRIMMLLGVLPALLTFLFRIFVPESHKWEEEQAKGGVNHWATRDLWGVLLGACGPILIIAVWASKDLPAPGLTRAAVTLVGLLVAMVGYLYPVYGYLQRSQGGDPRAQVQIRFTIRRMLLAALLSGIPLLGTWGSTQWASAWAGKLTEGATLDSGMLVLNAKEFTQIFSSAGAIVGTILAALMGDWLGRRLSYVLLCVSAMFSVLWFYQGHNAYGTSFLVSVFVLGVTTASFYGWLPLYLPELFRTSVRATGQGFGFNFGRILSAIGALQIGALLGQVAEVTTWSGLKGGYPVVCSFASAVYLLGIVVIAFAPETRGQPLPD